MDNNNRGRGGRPRGRGNNNGNQGNGQRINQATDRMQAMSVGGPAGQGAWGGQARTENPWGGQNRAGNAWGTGNGPSPQQTQSLDVQNANQPPPAWGGQRSSAPAAPPSAATSVQSRLNQKTQPNVGQQQQQRPVQEKPVNAPKKQTEGRAGKRQRGLPDDMLVLRTRPEHCKSKQGCSGRPIQLTANYFTVPKPTKWSMFQYHAYFTPEVETTSIRKGLLGAYKNKFDGYLFNGNVLLTCAKREDEILITTKTRAGDGIQIRLVYVGLVEATEQAALQVYNCIVRSSMEQLNYQQIRRQFFDMNAKMQIPEFRLEIIPGFVTSMRQHEENILLCVDMNSKVMRQDTCLDILKNLYAQQRRDPQLDVVQKFKDEMVGLMVLTRYNNRTYRVTDVDFNTTPTSSFTIRTNETEVYRDYYQRKYSIPIHDTRQPMLVGRSTEKQQKRIEGQENIKIYLIPELCFPCGFTDSMRKNFRLMKAVADRTQAGPSERMRQILQLNQNIQNSATAKNKLTEFHLDLDRNLVKLTGRVLNAEPIQFAKTAVSKTDWAEDLRAQQVLAKANLPNSSWAFIVSKRNATIGSTLVKVLQKTSRSIGLQYGDPNMIVMQNERTQDVIRAIAEAAKNGPSIIVFLLEYTQLYGAIKTECFLHRSIPSQVITLKVADKKESVLMSICTKVAIQMNCKLGAMPWALQNYQLGKSLIVGFDVCHDTNKSNRQSFGAMVAAMDLKTNSKYYSSVSCHANGEEISNNIASQMVQAVEYYRKEHQGELPVHIIFYRDGVGDGQIQHVHAHETKSIERALKSVYGEIPFSFTMVVVSKRINTRLFDGRNNVKPGTVVDSVITLPERYDFFLVSAEVRHSTATPTSYNVIHDTSKILTPDRLQSITYKLCHLYFNWSGPIRVPAPCQYAHKLAFLCGKYLHASPSNELNNQLYFL